MKSPILEHSCQTAFFKGSSSFIRKNSFEVIYYYLLAKCLCDERCLLWHVASLREHVPRSDGDIDRGSVLSDIPRKRKPVHRAGHIDIRKEQDSALPMLRQKNDCLICIEAFVHTETGILKDAGGSHHNYRIVLDDNSERAG
jgi:hypothetical protein